ncbi:MAG: hypothetical protein WA584_11470 [Pyrinomonadaceae bacterium]
MKHIEKSLIALFVFLLLVSNSSAQERNYEMDTSAGKLSISSTSGELECVIKLGKKVISTYDCDTSPYVLKHVKSAISPFDEVIVFQNRMLGNACDGTDIFFLGINKNGSYKISDSIGYCGGPAPLVTVGANKITITFPRRRPNRGTGWLRKEVWEYKNGKIREIKQTKRKNK